MRVKNKKIDLDVLDKPFIDKMLSLGSDSEREQEIEEHYDLYLLALPQGEYKKLVLKKMWGVYLDSCEKTTEVEIAITRGEIDFIKGLPDDEIKRVFYSLICRAKVKPHESGWIKLDFKNTMRYGFEKKRAAKLKLEDLSRCRDFGFDARVIGSNDPMVCFKLPEIGGDDEVVERFVESASVAVYEELFGKTEEKKK